jgi:glucokinase
MGKDDRTYIGIDLGGTNIQAGVLDGRNRLLGRSKAKTLADEGADKVVKRVARVANEAAEEARVPMTKVAGVCVGAPGVVDINQGVVRRAVNLRWDDFPLAEALRKELRVPVTLDNDVNVGTWAEHQLGAGQGFDDLLGVFVGTGVGGGVVLGGKLYHGHHLTAGEIGHNVIHADAQLGRRTVENCASRTAIVNLLTQLIRTNHPSKIVRLVDGDLNNIRSKALASALHQHDSLTSEVVRQAARYVGIAIANIVTVLSLPCVVVGGGVTEALGRQFVDHVRDAFEKNVFPSELRVCKILQAKLGDDAGLIGAALLARSRTIVGKRA